ncbi:phosphate acyltransferase PlsX [candidate division KSB1 bacterium]|nr:phosphate acyltransferase PlsX [bacterium]OQX58051.1 MAG: phosphate--acyl-ACP acyltransferase [candidate division KSB1 bacterium 4484_219]RKY77934.1 MAG: phosphate acyltransferase PlsX [candidate division KSB1 bacterium]HDI51655.1 phosphate acyltransferase PlsX [Bacteroidota bacterium]RKY80991.1 MAG: phosphate acyltransferase PlsX [candidate division KSB1 bacterium]
MRIAVDAMGGDFAPGAIVEGAVQAARVSKGHYEIVLVGDKRKIQEELSKYPLDNLQISVHHTSQKIEMNDPPTAALKEKKDSSIGIAVRLHKEGKVDAVVSAGNTGAFMTAALFELGRIPGVHRPALGSFIPTERGVSIIIDVGANADCKPFNLLQFGIMGSVYVAHVFDTQNPTVGLLSIGEEENKGSKLIREAHQLFKNSHLNFIGNVEGRDILKGKAEVIVCDGFVGNVVLKFTESMVGMLTSTIRRKVGGNILGNIGAYLLKPTFRKLRKLMDYQEYGGVPLLGIKGVSIKCHGSSTPKAIRNAIREAQKMITENVNGLIEAQIAKELGG